MSNYVTLSDLKAFLDIDQNDQSEDTKLSKLIPQISNALDEYTGRSFGSADYTEIYTGNGKPFIVLNQRPVTAITSVYLDETAYWGQAPGAWDTTTLLTQGVDYALDIDQPDGSSRSGRLFNINGWWPEPFNFAPGIISPLLGPETGNIQITYTAGYATVPPNITTACCLAIAKVRNMAIYGQAVTGEGYEDWNYTLPVGSRHIFSPEVRSLLARYRNVAVA